MGHTDVSVELNPGKVAPRYSREICDRELLLEKVVVTEQGTTGGLPIVDLQFKDIHGKEYFACVTGRILNAVAAVVKGVNRRIHGADEP